MKTGFEFPAALLLLTEKILQLLYFMLFQGFVYFFLCKANNVLHKSSWRFNWLMENLALEVVILVCVYSQPLGSVLHQWRMKTVTNSGGNVSQVPPNLCLLFEQTQRQPKNAQTSIFI